MDIHTAGALATLLYSGGLYSAVQMGNVTPVIPKHNFFDMAQAQYNPMGQRCGPSSSTTRPVFKIVSRKMFFK